MVRGVVAGEVEGADVSVLPGGIAVTGLVVGGVLEEVSADARVGGDPVDGVDSPAGTVGGVDSARVPIDSEREQATSAPQIAATASSFHLTNTLCHFPAGHHRDITRSPRPLYADRSRHLRWSLQPSEG